MNILVYGAGNIGSLFAARLKDAGHGVTILARGRRRKDIGEHGIRLEEFETGQSTSTPIDVIEQLGIEDAFDLVLVVLTRNRVAEVLPILAANRNTPSVMFFGNNAAGAEAMTRSLGRGRVLLGFPGAAAVAHGDHIRYLILDSREQPTTIGEVNGTASVRIDAIADAFRSAGFPVSISTNMDAWLKTHAAEISPTANALSMAGGDIGRLKRTRDALVLMVRAIREGFATLTALGIPVTPSIHRLFRWIPEPLLLVLIRRRLEDDAMTIKIGHASAAQEEMKAIADEFGELVSRTGVDTPSINALRRHLDGAEPVADGTASIPIRWRSVGIALILATVVAGIGVWLLR